MAGNGLCGGAKEALEEEAPNQPGYSINGKSEGTAGTEEEAGMSTGLSDELF